ncbi:porin [Undibacterium sp. LX40W]|uniref:Porin n=1 Tax=Undibacterium nitidum TaxID=2762298 RepID=A0A923HNV5_9BURK|nr:MULTISPECIES: porin [Undibacterium]MBC3880535.1 porin [Undibacterium nitidum]MBC3890729.1 porin [Undibacterium sp. LX40W]
MKLKMLAAVLGTCFAAPVLAQSNVTVYGILDAGIQFNSNGKANQTKMVSGIADGSRLGFKGTEDMGGGYKAIFNLEARVEVDTGSNKAGNISDYQGYALTKGMSFPDFGSPVLKGAAAQTLQGVREALQPKYNVNATNTYVLQRGGGPDGGMFDRTAMVGLITPVGAVLAGRMYTPAYEIFNGADTFESGMAGSWGGITGGTGGLLTSGMAIRSNKALQYRIELPNGIAASLMYGFKNSGYVGLDDKFIAGMVKYKANGFDVGIGYNRGTNMDGTTGLITSTAGGSYSTGDFKFFAGYQAMKNENSILLPVFYDAWDKEIGASLKAAGVPAPVLAAWTSIFRTTVAKNFKLDATSFSLGLQYKVGNGRIMTSFSRQDDRTLSNSDASQIAIGYDYNLSKRTDLYTVFGRIKNQNDGQYALGAASASGGFTETPGGSARAVQVGMRHRF